jgi:hypothetical protein
MTLLEEAFIHWTTVVAENNYEGRHVVASDVNLLDSEKSNEITMNMRKWKRDGFLKK